MYSRCQQFAEPLSYPLIAFLGRIVLIYQNRMFSVQSFGTLGMQFVWTCKLHPFTPPWGFQISTLSYKHNPTEIFLLTAGTWNRENVKKHTTTWIFSATQSALPRCKWQAVHGEVNSASTYGKIISGQSQGLQNLPFYRQQIPTKRVS